MIINFEQKKELHIALCYSVELGDSSANVTGQLGFTSCSLLPCLESCRAQFYFQLILGAPGMGKVKVARA